MSTTVIAFLCLLFSFLGILYCPRWIKTAHSSKDSRHAVFCLLVSVFMLVVSLWLIVYDNSILWFGQKNPNSNIEIDISSKNAEDTSILYLLNEFQSETKPSDIEQLLGSNYTLNIDSRYEMRYDNLLYTLGGFNTDILIITFNRKGTEILSITWGRKILDDSCYNEIFDYLKNDVLGSPISAEISEANWVGFHLEDTSYFVLFEKIF